MREILFRGKRVDNGEWAYGAYYGLCRMTNKAGGFEYEHLMRQSNNEPLYMVDAETVGQYTGLTDKNGKRIFEGDICKTYFESYTHSWEEVGVVTEFCGAYGIESADRKHFRAFINELVYTRSHEVIGNIHDNPELLEEEE